jgi:hypothetical protein
MKWWDDKKDFYSGRFTGDSPRPPLGQMIEKHPDFLFAQLTLKI